MRINNNLNAVDAQRNLMMTGMTLSKSVERLSSGLRINRAADDAAGLSISEKLRAQIGGLAQAQRNAQDGISMIQTGEGALNEVHSMLQRMRELAVEASNDTLSPEDRTNVNAELQQLKAEINNISSTTKFNGKQLLTGSMVTSLGGATATDAVVGDTLTATGGNATITAVDVANAKAGDTYTITSTAAGTLTMTRGSDSVAQTINVNALGANASSTLNFSTLGVSITLQADSGGKTQAGIVADLTAAANDTVVTAAGSGSANFQIGADASDFINVAFAKVDVSATGLSALDTALTNFNTTQSVANAQSLITAVDTSVSSVSASRSTLGAVQNRLEHTIANVGVAHENLLASESRIRDADMAAEMVTFTKTQILQQAGTAILAQANTGPQSILSLLR
jgi:flagellin